MKKRISVFIVLGLVLLLIGSVYNFQKGLALDDDFWKLRRDGRYTHGKDSILCTSGNKGVHFDVILNDRSFTADMTFEDENTYIEFSDGWAIRFAESASFPAEIGDILFSTNYSLIPLDFGAMGCRFEKGSLVTEPLYNENSHHIGEYHTLTTASGEIIEAWETWDDPGVPGEISPDRCEVLEIAEGEPLTSYERYDQLFVNSDGEYLMNPEVLFNIEGGYESPYRVHFARLLEKMSAGNAAARGSIVSLIMYLAFYCLGAAQWLWPDKMAFLGARWQFRNDPELSDEGRAIVRAGGVVIMLMSVFILFLPTFA